VLVYIARRAQEFHLGRVFSSADAATAGVDSLSIDTAWGAGGGVMSQLSAQRFYLVIRSAPRPKSDTALPPWAEPDVVS
jgi:hypothetical protein